MGNYIDWKHTSALHAFEMIGLIPERRIESAINRLKGSGYTEENIVYVLSLDKVQEKLTKFFGDPRVVSIFENKVRKLAFKPGDPRWAKYKR